MRYDHLEDLFPEEGAWREPGDDAKRMGYYALFALASIGTSVGSMMAIIHALTKRAEFWPYFLMGLIGLVISGFFAALLAKEARHWSWGRITFDKIVAGIILIGIGIFVVMLPVMGEAPLAMPAVLAVSVGLTVFGLALGLLGAVAEKISLRKRRLGKATVIERYALTDDLSRIDDAVCPHDDGMTAIVVLRFIGRKPRKFFCTPLAYEMCRPGTHGVAYGNDRQLAEFRAR